MSGVDLDFEKQAKDSFYANLSDKERIDTLLLPALMYHGINALQKKGTLFREDITIYLSKSMDRSLHAVKSEGMRIKYIKEASDVAKAMLDSMNPADEVQALKAAALMIVCMAEQELLVDKTSNAVFAALLITQQAQDENHSGQWGSWNDAELRDMINKGLTTAQLRGHL